MKGTIRDFQTTTVKEPTWAGNSFIEEDANTLWLLLPEILHRIGLEELRAGNTVSTIFRNHERGIAFVEFAREPRAATPQSGIIVYGEQQAFSYGFYASKCVYKDPVSGSVLSFYKEEPERGTA